MDAYAFLFGALIVYRLGSHIPVPGMNPVSLANFSRVIAIPFWVCLMCFLEGH